MEIVEKLEEVAICGIEIDWNLQTEEWNVTLGDGTEIAHTSLSHIIEEAYLYVIGA